MPLQHLPLFVRGRIAHLDFEQKTVKLRLWKRIRTLKVDRVLGGENREPLRQLSRNAVARHLALFHAFEQRRLRARRHAVDLIDQQKISKDRARVKRESICAGLEDSS